MPTGSELFAAGAYTMTYGGTALGLFEGDQGLPTLEHNVKSEPMNNTSAWAKTKIAELYQGADWFFQFVCLEWGKAAVKTAFWPYASALGALGIIGRDLYDLAAPLVMTVVAGTPAAAQGPATLTATKSILVPGFVPRVVFGPTWRHIPLRLSLFPLDLGGGVYGHFSST